MLILEDWKALARLCRKLRTDAGLSQKQLADAMGDASVQDVSNAESEKQPSRQAMRRRVLEHFGYSVTDSFKVEEVRKS